MKKIWTKALAYMLAITMCFCAVNVSVYAQGSTDAEVSTEAKAMSEAVTDGNDGSTWNQDIATGKSIEFGISGERAFRGFPEKYKVLSTNTEVPENDYTILYKSDSDWGTGFTGSISIKNNTEETLEDWVLEFDFDRNITGIWEGVIQEYEGNHYVVRNAEYNSNIAPGGSISIGFKGCGGESGDKPINYVLYSYNFIDEYVVDFCVGAENVDNIPKNQIVKSGECIEKPQNPVREGFYFIGWYVDDIFSKEFDFENTVINEDVKLYARWIE